jgi:hypothetical protein
LQPQIQGGGRHSAEHYNPSASISLHLCGSDMPRHSLSGIAERQELRRLLLEVQE